MRTLLSASGSEISNSRSQIDFRNLLSADLQQLSNHLADGIFAAYLLGYDISSTECAANIKSANFAEGDGKKKPGRVRSVTYLPKGKDETAAEITDDKKITIGLRFDVPPKEAIDYFIRKKILSPEEFYKLEKQARVGAFTVGGVYDEDVLKAFRTEIEHALATGQTQKTVIENFKNILNGAGHAELGTGHLENVFRTNMQTAYGVGRRKAQEDVAEYLPYWEYTAVGDDRTRPTHMALDGLIYPVNHPFWDTYFPPWDYRCRCSTIALPDYRSGYNHDRPNADTTLGYDVDGLPTTATHLGKKVDLTPGDFVGVPSGANLESILKSAAEAAKENRKK